jgi:tetratricopeptide (TPR) repeat protein
MGKDLLTKPYRVLFFDELEDYKLAIKKLTEYLESHPQSGIAYNNQGLAHSEVGESDEAFRDFAEAMRYAPDNPIPYLNRGDLYLRHKERGNVKEAIDDFTRAISIDGSDASFHRCRAYACLEAERFQEAIDSFSQAIGLEPDFRQTYFDRAKAYQGMGDQEKADQDLSVASRLPQWPSRK